MLSLQRLPREVIAIVAAMLDGPFDLFNLRLTSRALNNGSFYHFRRRYFYTRHHMLEESSLKNLVQLSEHQAFGPYIRELNICPDHLTEKPPKEQPGTGYWAEVLVRAQPTTINREAYRERLERQKDTIKSGSDAKYLICALKGLSSCKTITINDEYRPWGATSLRRETGAFPTSSIEEPSSKYFTRRLLCVVLLAIAKSEIAIEEFGLIFGIQSVALTPDMLTIPKLVAEKVQPSLTSVITLDLTLDHNRKQGIEDYTRNLCEFVEMFPNLEKFFLGFDSRNEEERFSIICRRLHMPRLKVLSMGLIDCSKADLGRFLLRHKGHLEEIYFNSMEVYMDEIDSQYSIGIDSWRSTIELIRDELSISKLNIEGCFCGEEFIVLDDNPYSNLIEVDGDPQALTEICRKIRPRTRTEEEAIQKQRKTTAAGLDGLDVSRILDGRPLVPDIKCLIEEQYNIAINAWDHNVGQE